MPLMILRARHTTLLTVLTLLAYLLGFSAAWALPFSSSTSDNELEQVDRWLASPSTVAHRALLNRAPSILPDIKDRVLILTPLKDAAQHLPHHFALLANLTYPHHLIDLGFIIGDTTDDTRNVLNKELDRLLQSQTTPAFNSCTIVLKNLGDSRSQDVASRHGFDAQVKRRKKLAIVRNALLKETLKEEHTWVYWRDVDIAESPSSILEDFIAHGKDVLVPSQSFEP